MLHTSYVQCSGGFSMALAPCTYMSLQRSIPPGQHWPRRGCTHGDNRHAVACTKIPESQLAIQALDDGLNSDVPGNAQPVAGHFHGGMIQLRFGVDCMPHAFAVRSLAHEFFGLSADVPLTPAGICSILPPPRMNSSICSLKRRCARCVSGEKVGCMVVTSVQGQEKGPNPTIHALEIFLRNARLIP